MQHSSAATAFQCTTKRVGLAQTQAGRCKLQISASCVRHVTHDNGVSRTSMNEAGPGRDYRPAGRVRGAGGLPEGRRGCAAG